MLPRCSIVVVRCGLVSRGLVACGLVRRGLVGCDLVRRRLWSGRLWSGRPWSGRLWSGPPWSCRLLFGRSITADSAGGVAEPDEDRQNERVDATQRRRASGLRLGLRLCVGVDCRLVAARGVR